MASIAREGDGFRIQWFSASGKRESIRTGKMSETNAEGIKRRIEGLLAARASGEPMPRSLAEWVAGLSDKAHAKLAARGLLESREARRAWTVGELLTRYFDSIGHVKESTRTSYTNARRMLREHFGERRTLASIAALDAEGWVGALRKSKLAKATASKRIVIVKQIFARAVRWGMIPTNPFADIRAGAQHNDERTTFVSREVIERVLEACPNAEWRAIVALARFGGLRTPSETLALRWADVDWHAGKMRVRSPKSESTEGRGHRLVPLFPEIRGLLLEAYEEAADGAEFVVASYRGDANLRTEFARILERANVPAWPRLFHALRGSRATELHAAYPAKDASAWMGHGVGVALRHYATARGETFAAAVATPTGAMPETGAENGARAVQKTARRRGAQECEAVKHGAQTHEECTVTHKSANPRTFVQGSQVGLIGLEPTTSPLSGVRSTN
jgi:integrase